MPLKHTPPPWRVGALDDGQYQVLADQTAAEICWVDRDVRIAKGRTKRENKANAFLIAAAPELLDAAKELLSSLEGPGLARLRAAVAKAEGD